MFTSRGPGFRRLAQAHAGSVAADTLVAMALAGTLFFDVPSTEARDKVALYLLITLAPFAVIGPFLGAAYARFPGAYRGGMVFSSGHARRAGSGHGGLAGRFPAVSGGVCDIGVVTPVRHQPLKACFLLFSPRGKPAT